MAENGEDTDAHGDDPVVPDGPSGTTADAGPADAGPANQPPPYVPPTAQEPLVEAQDQAQPGAPSWSQISPGADDQPAVGGEQSSPGQPWDPQPTRQWQQPVEPAPAVPAPPPAASPPAAPTGPPQGQQGPPAASWTVPGSPPTMQQPLVAQPPVVGQPLGQPQQQYQPQYQPQAQPQYQQQYPPQQYQQPYGAPQQPLGQPYGAPQQPGAPTGPTRGGGPMAILGGLLLLLGGVALIVGSFLDWGEGLVANEKVILTGFKNAQGELWGAPGTLAAGAVLLLAGVLYLASMKRGVGGLKRTLALLGSLGGLGWVVFLLVSLQLDEANALIGLWLCLAGSVLGLVGTFLGRGKKQAARPKT